MQLVENTNSLVKFNFQGDELDVIKEGETLWVSVRRVCEALGLATNGQIEKLKSKAWARDKIILSPDARGYNQSAFMIDLDSFPMWLANIETVRVADHVRPKLVAYQKEAAKALRNYFFNGHAICDHINKENAIRIKKALTECLNIFAKADVEADNQSLDVLTFLMDKGSSRKDARIHEKNVHRIIRIQYINKYGREPKKYTVSDSLPFFERAYKIICGLDYLRDAERLPHAPN